MSHLQDFAASQPKPGYVAVLMMRCPKCGAEQEDHDGFGVLFCPKCGYCTHASVNGNVCGLCGHQIARGGLPESESLADKLARLEAENKQLRTRAEEAEDGWHGALLKLGRPEQRQTHEVLAEVAATLGKILTTLEHANSVAREGAVSSVQIEETAKGPRVTVKIYAGSIAPVDEAIEDFGRAFRLAQEGQMRNWEATVAQLAEAKSA